MGCFEKIDPGQFYEAVFLPATSLWHHIPISYRFLREATIIISYRFLFEATGISELFIQSEHNRYFYRTICTAVFIISNVAALRIFKSLNQGSNVLCFDIWIDPEAYKCNNF